MILSAGEVFLLLSPPIGQRVTNMADFEESFLGVF